jgi:hypothetical protein
MPNMTKQISSELRGLILARSMEVSYHKSERARCQKVLDADLKFLDREKTRVLARMDKRIAVLRGRLS